MLKNINQTIFGREVYYESNVMEYCIVAQSEEELEIADIFSNEEIGLEVKCIYLYDYIYWIVKNKPRYVANKLTNDLVNKLNKLESKENQTET